MLTRPALRAEERNDEAPRAGVGPASRAPDPEVVAKPTHRRGDVARADHALDVVGGDVSGQLAQSPAGAVGTVPRSVGEHSPHAARKRRYMRIDVASPRAYDREAVAKRRNSTSL